MTLTCHQRTCWEEGRRGEKRRNFFCSTLMFHPTSPSRRLPTKMRLALVLGLVLLTCASATPHSHIYRAAATSNEAEENSDGNSDKGNNNANNGNDNEKGKRVFCHLSNWSRYRPGNGKFEPSDLDPTLCTDVVYSFAGLDEEKWEIRSTDPWSDLPDDSGLDGFGQAAALREKNPRLKVILGVGGFYQSSRAFSEMAKDEEKRKKFTESVPKFLKKYKFDGLHLQWQHPGRRGGDPKEDRDNFSLLVRELRQSLGADAMLAAAVGATRNILENSYDLAEIYRHLDFVTVMAYDYHGMWSGAAGHNAPLRRLPGAGGDEPTLNVEATLDLLEELGADMGKTVLGVPVFGRTFVMKDPSETEVGSPVEAEAFKGPFTREDGLLAYNEVCLELRKKKEENDHDVWTTKWDPVQEVPYAFATDADDGRWMSFDVGHSMRLKCRLAVERGLAGASAWAADGDDFRGDCGADPFPMLRAINVGLGRRDLVVKKAETQVRSEAN